MALRVGQHLLHYEILALLGSGGAGDVYRARDTKLGREVAIKALSGRVATDTERLQRLNIEAKALASLNHTNLAHVYGIEQAEGLTFIVMEFVPGETLAARLKSGPLPVAEALELGRQIAVGLEEAHEHGIVHRDLKPENVCVTEEGVAKVLDFGLAKLHPEAEAGGGEGLVTEQGVLNGTPPYMSPEHIGGGKVDRRTDIWALGCVLYECLTGQRAFQGRRFPEISMAVQDDDPDWDRLPPDTPRSVRHLLVRMLEKDPRIRLRDMGEVRIALTPGSSSWEGEDDARTTVHASAATARPSRATSLWGGVLAALALATAFYALWVREPSPPSMGASYLDVTPAEAKFRPSGAVLGVIEEAIRGGLVPSLGAFTLVDREPLELAQVRVYHDTSALHLRSALSGLSHTFSVEGEVAHSGWTFYHCPSSTQLRRRVLRETNVGGVSLDTPVGTTILDRVGRQDFDLRIRSELAADLGRGLDLHPRVLLVVTSKRWWYQQVETERRICMEMSSVAAMWWIPGTAGFLDDAFRGLGEVPRVGIDAAWSEHEIVGWRELSLDSSDSTVEIPELPELSEFRARFELEDVVAVSPKYHFAVDQLLSEVESSGD